MRRPRKKGNTETAAPAGDSPVAILPEQQEPQQTAPQLVGETSAAASPDRERIAMRAYELYLARGGGDGRELDDWLTAERELNAPAADREPE
jgi:hypothetical protein